MIKYIPINEKETIEIMHKFGSIDLAFGTGGVALKYNTSEPMKDDIKHLLLMRGILNENMDGAGI